MNIIAVLTLSEDSKTYILTKGKVEDYAVYQGCCSTPPMYIASNGEKISAKEAMKLFPRWIKKEGDYRV